MMNGAVILRGHHVHNRCIGRIRRRLYDQRDYSSFRSAASSAPSLAFHQRCSGGITLSKTHRNYYEDHRSHYRQFHNTPSTPSDNLLGHSPMARSLPNNTSNTPPSSKGISPFGVDSNNTGGGIWEQTSTKKTKLNELLSELTERGIDTGLKGMETLDDVAVGEETLDLELVGGLKILVKGVDDGSARVVNVVVNGTDHDDVNEATTRYHKNEVINTNIEQAAQQAIKQLFKLFENTTSADEWTKKVFESKLNEAIRILSEGCLPNTIDLETGNKKKKSLVAAAGSLDVSHPFCYLRQFVVSDAATTAAATATTDENNDKHNELDPNIQEQIQQLNNITSHALSSSTLLYRTLLLRATAQTLLDNWDKLVTITSGDVDRAAISKTTIPSTGQRETVNAQAIQSVLQSYAQDSPQEWVQSWWKLIDADNDGLIDQEEMNACVDLCIEPVHLALGDVFDMTLEVCPVRTIGMGGVEEAKRKNAWFLGVEHDDEGGGVDADIIPTHIPPAKLSWRNRRKELKQRKILTKTFQGTIARHFRDQAEAPHRLRCIYAWAEKAHQDNKLDSVLVDASEEWGSGAASAVMGRKRYVELEPKISYEEFREVQKKTFPHLDRIGEEIVTSFKEDLWLLQGSKRQNNELKRDGLLFLLAISVVDLGIWMV